jgi:hypothetical protein
MGAWVDRLLALDELALMGLLALVGLPLVTIGLVGTLLERRFGKALRFVCAACLCVGGALLVLMGLLALARGAAATP